MHPHAFPLTRALLAASRHTSALIRFAGLTTLVAYSLLVGLELLTRLGEARHWDWLRTGAPARPRPFYKRRVRTFGLRRSSDSSDSGEGEQLLYGDPRRLRTNEVPC